MTECHTGADSRPPRRFRWRIIPAAFLLIFGGLLVVVGIASLNIAVVAFFYPAISDSAISAAGRGLSLFGGLLWLASGRWCLRGRWMPAIIGAAAGYVYTAVVFSPFESG